MRQGKAPVEQTRAILLERGIAVPQGRRKLGCDRATMLELGGAGTLRDEEFRHRMDKLLDCCTLDASTDYFRDSGYRRT